MTSYHVDDLRLKAEREVVERLFKSEVLAETKHSKKEQEVRRIAASLFLSYFDSDEHDEVLFGPRWQDPVILPKYLEKGEKIYNIAGDFETANKILTFIKTIDPILAKQVVDKL